MAQIVTGRRKKNDWGSKLSDTIYLYLDLSVLYADNYGVSVSIGKAAKELGVSRDTLRRWEAAGKIAVERTPNGHRRYDLAKLRGLVARQAPSARVTLA